MQIEAVFEEKSHRNLASFHYIKRDRPVVDVQSYSDWPRSSDAFGVYLNDLDRSHFCIPTSLFQDRGYVFSSAAVLANAETKALLEKSVQWSVEQGPNGFCVPGAHFDCRFRPNGPASSQGVSMQAARSVFERMQAFDCKTLPPSAVAFLFCIAQRTDPSNYTPEHMSDDTHFRLMPHLLEKTALVTTQLKLKHPALTTESWSASELLKITCTAEEYAFFYPMFASVYSVKRMAQEFKVLAVEKVVIGKKKKWPVVLLYLPFFKAASYSSCPSMEAFREMTKGEHKHGLVLQDRTFYSNDLLDSLFSMCNAGPAPISLDDIYAELQSSKRAVVVVQMPVRMKTIIGEIQAHPKFRELPPDLQKEFAKKSQKKEKKSNQWLRFLWAKLNGVIYLGGTIAEDSKQFGLDNIWAQTQIAAVGPCVSTQTKMSDDI